MDHPGEAPIAKLPILAVEDAVLNHQKASADAPDSTKPKANQVTKSKQSGVWDKTVIFSDLIFKGIPPMIAYSLRIVWRRLMQRFTYTPNGELFGLHPTLADAEASLTDSTETKVRNIVIMGGSFGGVLLATTLGRIVRNSGWRIILAEKNENLHLVWNFPRYTALNPDDPGGKERVRRAMVSYDGVKGAAREGIIEMIRGEVVRVLPKEQTEGGENVKGFVELKTKEVIPFYYLVVATGSEGSRLAATDEADCCAELTTRAEAVKAARNIIVIGGGAVGVELALDIKDLYKDEKEVTLIHSRERLLGRFGERLAERTMEKCEELGLRVILGEKPALDWSNASSSNLPSDMLAGPGSITLPSTSEQIPYDLIIKCTGGGSHSATSSLRNFLPESAFNNVDGRLKTDRYLRVDGLKSNVFAVGDVSDPEVPAGIVVPKMARAARTQAFVTAENLYRLMYHIDSTAANSKDTAQDASPALMEYTPILFEESIKLTLGLEDACMWGQSGKREIAMNIKLKNMDLDSAWVWRMFNVGNKYPVVEGAKELKDITTKKKKKD